MEKLTKEAAAILAERFGRDSIIALATSENNIPHSRSIDAYYENGDFYAITYALSGKMQQISKNPLVAISGDWFTAHGRAVSLGYFGKPENAEIAGKLRKAFASWIDNGHNNFEDENTIILCIRLTDGVLFAQGRRYEIDFTK